MLPLWNDQRAHTGRKAGCSEWHINAGEEKTSVYFSCPAFSLSCLTFPSVSKHCNICVVVVIVIPQFHFVGLKQRHLFIFQTNVLYFLKLLRNAPAFGKNVWSGCFYNRILPCASIMQAITDPVHILLLGGYQVGKTTLLQRLTGSKQYASRSAGLNMATFHLPLKNSLTIPVYVYNLSADILHMTSMPPTLAKMLERSEGALLVTEPCNKATATWTDMALDLIQENCPSEIVKILLVNKADLPWEDHVFAAHHLEQFAVGNDLVDWAYTVATSQLADVDPARGSTLRQRSPEDLLSQLIITILQQRQDQFYKLLSLPLQLRFVQQRSMELYELDQLFPSP
jgi:hypothetical protein